jgi:hypothetical protein
MPVNGSVAPVCPISRSQVPLARAAAPIAILRPTDLPSAIAAINQLITILNPLIQNNTVAITTNLKGFPYIPRWHEIQRDTTIVRISNPKDPEMWVDVERINNLVFYDKTSDQQFQWTY